VGAIADALGYFELQGIGDRPVRLVAEHTGYTPMERLVRAGEEVELQLQRLTSASGRIQDSRTAAPIPVFSIIAEGNAGRWRRRFKDPRGRFTFTGLPAGKLTLRAEAAGYAPAQVEIQLQELEPSRSSETVLALARAGALEGQILDAVGQPVPGAGVEIAGVKGTTDSRGEVKITGIPEGSHVVQVRTRTGRILRSDPVTVRADGLVTTSRILVL